MKELIQEMYAWFNQVCNSKYPFSKQDLEKYFTPALTMDTNGQTITAGYDALFDHIEKIRNGEEAIEFRPFEDLIISEDRKKCAVSYKIKVTAEGGEISYMYAIALWYVHDDGRMSRTNEVV